MSKISTIVDNFRTRLSTLFSTHKELRNVQTIEDNDELYLSKGQGLTIGPGINSERQLSCRLSVQRDMTITLTRAMRGTDRDTIKRVGTEKDLLEDQFLLINDLEKDPSLDETLASIKFVGDSGIEEIFLGDGHFLMIRSTFQIEYLETLS